MPKPMRSESRRAALTVLLTALASPAASPRAGAQEAPARAFRIGWLAGASRTSYVQFLDAFRDALVALGWREGREFVLLARFAEGRLDNLDRIAADLVKESVDVIVATTPPTLVAARHATSQVPIVMVYGPDPAETGVVATLARPGGNVTGLTSLSVDLSLKQLELLRAMLHGEPRVAVLWNPDNAWHSAALERIRSKEASRGSSVTSLRVRVPDDIDKAFAAMAQQRIGALLCLSDPMTFSHRAHLAEVAIKYRLPSMHGVTAYADSGGLAAYWPNPIVMHRRAASYCYRILRGARAADLPIEQPSTFEFVVNLKTAKALGLKLPGDILARADRVIE